ncbi:hypothetical protein Tco_0927370 [Tanacetum coccineum]
MTSNLWSGHNNHYQSVPYGKTSGFERREPHATNPLGCCRSSALDYADRMWEEFTRSIHTFTEDKRNLAQHTLGKKKATPILILSISAKEHNENLWYVQYRMISSNEVILGQTLDAYLEKVAKHQRYIAGEELSDPESPAPKPTKPTKQAKPKATKQPTVSKTTTKQPTVSKTKAKKPKPAPANPQEKKRKPVLESSEAPPLAKRAKAGKVGKKRTVKSSKKLVDEFVDEGVPAAKPSLKDTEEAILQNVLEESLTDAYPTQRGYYRRFIANSSKVAKPLALLTQKIQKYEWVKEQEEAFQTLKDNLCDTPILSLPDGFKEFVTLMMDEAHASRYLVHSGADKTYYDLREMYGAMYGKGYCYLLVLDDANLHMHLEDIKVDKTLRFAEEPVEIIDREVKSLKCSRIPIVKSIGLEVDSIQRIQGLDTTYWGFLGVGTTLDIFQNIIFIPYFQYGILVFWIRRIKLYSSVVFGECKHGYAVSSLMDTAYWSSK